MVQNKAKQVFAENDLLLCSVPLKFSTISLISPEWNEMQLLKAGVAKYMSTDCRESLNRHIDFDFDLCSSDRWVNVKYVNPPVMNLRVLPALVFSFLFIYFMG